MFRAPQRAVDHACAAARLDAPPAAAFPALRAAPGNRAPDPVLRTVTEGKANIAAALLGGLLKIVDQIGIREVGRQTTQLEEVGTRGARALANIPLDIPRDDTGLIEKALQPGIARRVLGLVLDFGEKIGPAAILRDVDRAEPLRL